MIERIHQTDHYSPAIREAILNRLLTALQSDTRVTGLLVVGSGAEGFEDVHSDIDLCAVTTSVSVICGVLEEIRRNTQKHPSKNTQQKPQIRRAFRQSETGS